MALNLSEQLEVQAGQLKPTVVNDLLIDLSNAAAINFAREFNSTHKVIDVTGNSTTQEAENYLSKMLNATATVLTTDGAGKQSLNNTMASFIAAQNQSSKQGILDGSYEDWEGFILTNISKAIELYAGVRVNEKSAYDGYVEPA